MVALILFQSFFNLSVAALKTTIWTKKRPRTAAGSPLKLVLVQELEKTLNFGSFDY